MSLAIFFNRLLVSLQNGWNPFHKDVSSLSDVCITCIFLLSALPVYFLIQEPEWFEEPEVFYFDEVLFFSFLVMCFLCLIQNILINSKFIKVIMFSSESSLQFKFMIHLKFIYVRIEYLPSSQPCKNMFGLLNWLKMFLISIEFIWCLFKINWVGNSLAVQWLELQASTAGGMGSVPDVRTKIPQAAQCGQKTENYIKL